MRPDLPRRTYFIGRRTRRVFSTVQYEGRRYECARIALVAMMGREDTPRGEWDDVSPFQRPSYMLSNPPLPDGGHWPTMVEGNGRVINRDCFSRQHCDQQSATPRATPESKSRVTATSTGWCPPLNSLITSTSTPPHHHTHRAYRPSRKTNTETEGTSRRPRRRERPS